jgi:hypothetical protein
MGHDVDVNQNGYTKSSMDRRNHAVNLLERALGLEAAVTEKSVPGDVEEQNGANRFAG